jgi:transcription antitermination factor NusG
MLGLKGFGVYWPRILERRTSRGGRRLATPKPLFPNYMFISIEDYWWAARWCPGIAGILLAGDQPAKICDAIIDGIRGRERDGLVVLPPKLAPGVPVRVVCGVLIGLTGLHAGMRPRERVAVLLSVLGTVELPESDIEPV